MVEVFKTNIDDAGIADSILNSLITYLPHSYINFDLEDCDRILRIEDFHGKTIEVIRILNQNGFECERLD